MQIIRWKLVILSAEFEKFKIKILKAKKQNGSNWKN